ncbi:SURF1 family protein [Streptomyces sp. N2-109]|uniref:SURF1-like protein n=1 Tax=Streptomyces gossypii TaxID=2883101 RepID=A0ABT2JQ94_9ACTN|nr:SURF1 family protein [Streptomyces gossypii]MCT2589878.1 SURF1 family protein [Streptomyces gossypii]
MYRFLLTPRWWGINVFVVLAIPVCLFMGSWQLTRFEARVDNHQQQERSAADAAEARTAPLSTLLPVTQETSGRAARATGRFDTEHPLLVPDRRLDGERGFYVLNLLRTDSGKALPVVRGWLPGSPDPGKVPEAPDGEVTVTGSLQSTESERTPGASPGALPEGQLGIISDASLVNLVPYDVHAAWITVQRTDAPLKPVPPVAPANTGLDMKAFQNLGYTAEWFVFAGFVLFMWFRLFRREAELAKDAELGLSPEDPAPEAPPAPAESRDDATRTRSPSGAA